MDYSLTLDPARLEEMGLVLTTAHVDDLDMVPVPVSFQAMLKFPHSQRPPAGKWL